MGGKILAPFVAGAAVILAASVAQAGMDYGCLAACQQSGRSHRICAAFCADPNPPQSVRPSVSPPHGTDYRCVDRCTGTGRPRDYCLRNCSY